MLYLRIYFNITMLNQLLKHLVYFDDVVVSNRVAKFSKQYRLFIVLRNNVTEKTARSKYANYFKYKKIIHCIFT